MNKMLVTRRNPYDATGDITQAVRAGNHVFVGGVLPLDDSGRIIGSDITTQANTVFKSLKSILADAGAALSDVVKHNIYFRCDGGDEAVRSVIDKLDQVRCTYFTDPGPTTTEIRAGLDLEGALIQLDAWAVVNVHKQRLMPANHWTWHKKLPFSQGWKVGETIFVGGQRSLDGDGQVVGVDDIEVQTDSAFRNLDTMLRAAGGNRTNLMRQNTYFRFFGEGRSVTQYWEKMTKVRMRYMSVPSAAGAGLRIPGLPHAEELIQVEGIAVLGEDKRRLQPANHWDWSIPNTQFTQGWQIGNLAFIGGQISADKNACAVGSDIAAQTRNVFQFIRRVLHEGGLDESDVVKLYVYYHAPEDWKEISIARQTIAAIQQEFFSGANPATTALRVSGFAFENLLIEIEALAVTRD